MAPPDVSNRTGLPQTDFALSCPQCNHFKLRHCWESLRGDIALSMCFPATWRAPPRFLAGLRPHRYQSGLFPFPLIDSNPSGRLQRIPTATIPPAHSRTARVAAAAGSSLIQSTMSSSQSTAESPANRASSISSNTTMPHALRNGHVRHAKISHLESITSQINQRCRS